MGCSDGLAHFSRIEHSIEGIIESVEVNTVSVMFSGTKSTTCIKVTADAKLRVLEAYGALPLEKHDKIRAYWREEDSDEDDMFEPRSVVYKIEKMRNDDVVATYLSR